jgi:hypothetical protein
MEESKEKERRVYMRNALVCFACTAVCIAIDIRNFINAGHFYFTWGLALSCVIYLLFILMGIRAIKKWKEC